MGSEQWRPAEAVRPLEGIDVTVESMGHQWRVVHVAGELDMVTSPSLRSVVADVFSDGLLTGRTLVFDLTSVDFIGSSGIAVLAEAVQLAGKTGLPPVRVVLAARPVRRAVEVTGMDAVLAIFPDLATAIAD